MDQVSLQRFDVAQVGSTARGTLAVLPVGKKKQQKLVVGDDSGSMTGLAVKKGSVETMFRTLPGPHGVRHIRLSGWEGVPGPDLFAAVGTSVIGVDRRKGKELFRFDSPMTEPISRLATHSTDIWAVGEYTYSMYKDANRKPVREGAYYLSPDAIHDMLVLSGSMTILACQDRYVRVVNGSELASETAVPGSAVALAQYSSPNAEEPCIVFGTANGAVGMLQVRQADASLLWQCCAPDEHAGVQSLHVADVTGDGVKDVVVGRLDGTVHVYAFQLGPDEPPQQVMQVGLQESISTVSSGAITAPGECDLVACTYSGRVVTMTHNAGNLVSGAGSNTESLPTRVSQKQAASMAAEIDRLRERLAREKEKYSRVSSTVMTTVAQDRLPVQARMQLQPDEAWHTITLEIAVPIESVSLASDVPLTILDVDESVAVVSRSPPDPDNGHEMLVTYLCQEAVNRLEFRVRTIEGVQGTLHAFVLPRLHPKPCARVSFPIKPLSLHQRLHGAPQDAEGRVMNEINLNGPFSLNDMHTWVASALSDVPERPSGEQAHYWFRSSFTGSVISVAYRKGSAQFASDDAASLGVLRDVVLRDAMARKMQVALQPVLRDEATDAMLSVLYPKLTYQLSLSRKTALIEALRELKLQDQDVSYLSPDLLQISDSSEDIAREMRGREQHLAYLRHVFSNLFSARCKLSGIDPAARWSKINGLLDANASLPEIQQAFRDA